MIQQMNILPRSFNHLSSAACLFNEVLNALMANGYSAVNKKKLVAD